MWLQLLREKYRLGPFSVPDTLGSLIIVFLIAPFLSAGTRKLGVEVPRSSWLWLTVPVAELTHAFFRPDTVLFKMLMNQSGDYLVKIAFIAMIYLGVRGIHRIS